MAAGPAARREAFAQSRHVLFRMPTPASAGDDQLGNPALSLVVLRHTLTTRLRLAGSCQQVLIGGLCYLRCDRAEQAMIARSTGAEQTMPPIVMRDDGIEPVLAVNPRDYLIRNTIHELVMLRRTKRFGSAGAADRSRNT